MNGVGSADVCAIDDVGASPTAAEAMISAVAVEAVSFIPRSPFLLWCFLKRFTELATTAPERQARWLISTVLQKSAVKNTQKGYFLPG